MKFDSNVEKQASDQHIHNSILKDKIICDLMKRCTELEKEIRKWRNMYHKATGEWK